MDEKKTKKSAKSPVINHKSVDKSLKISKIDNSVSGDAVNLDSNNDVKTLSSSPKIADEEVTISPPKRRTISYDSSDEDIAPPSSRKSPVKSASPRKAVYDSDSSEDEA